MKHLLNGVAVAAALVIAAPAWAQNNPSGGNSVNTPGPNPGGPGLTPYSGGAPPAPPPAEPAPAAMPPSGAAPNSAMPPMHRQAHMRHYHHMMHGRIHHGPRNAEDTTAQLNRAELSRIQSGGAAAAPPPAPGGEPMQQQPGMRMPGPKPSGSGYIPPSQPPQPQ